MNAHTTTRPQVGDSITYTDSRRYTTNGVQAYHTYILRALVVRADEVGFDATVTEVLAEENRPEWATSGHPTGIKWAWFGWDAAVARGEASLSADPAAAAWFSDPISGNLMCIPGRDEDAR